jgi:hypothetical protein
MRSTRTFVHRSRRAAVTATAVGAAVWLWRAGDNYPWGESDDPRVDHDIVLDDGVLHDRPRVGTLDRSAVTADRFAR